MKRRLYTGRDPARALSIEELQAMAARRMPGFVTEYVEGGADDERALAANRAAFGDIRFRPHVLTGAGEPNTRTTIAGRDIAMPLLVAPTGFAGLLRRGGDVMLARAAAGHGILFVQSMVSNSMLESVSAIPDIAHWMQLYMLRDRAVMAAIVDRARIAGAGAIVVTVDANHYGNREWHRRLFRSESSLRWRAKLGIARRPSWISDVLARGLPGFVNLYPYLAAEHKRDLLSSAHWVRGAIDPWLDWSAVAWLRVQWPGTLIVKGVARIDDVLRAVDHGADGVVLSNHGGRQLDGAAPALAAVAEVRRAVGKHMILMIDGGIRRGSDIVKAVALGADAVLAGRAMLYGLAAAGEAGVARSIAILHEEMKLTMALLGAADIAGLDADLLEPERFR